ncbi:MAG: polyprenyl synthetase family protein [Deltaproteobacteria bacterium]|nr:polyprenyl synthetase family protein [Deltaproteobacteria bacterium]
MAERIPQIDAAIEARFERASDRVPAPLSGAMRHLLFPGGKRLRPVFALAAAEAVGGRARAALPLAVAVELIHTYSLVHDDLPCMDDDDWRRGRPTVHVAFDEATAVLAGDALQSEAFAVLAEDPVAAADPARMLFVVGRLARAIGAEGLVGGQQDDLAFEAVKSAGKGGADHVRLASIHERKTAALFQAAIVGGAALGGANDDERGRLEAFARDVGVAFQIADDLLDADSAEAASILRLQGQGDARAGAEGLVERALERIEGFGERAMALRELARFAVRRRR